jgi:predicted nucleotidyltransferase
VSIFDESLPPSATTLQEAFKALALTLNERGVRYAIIGGIALLQHTRVRTTEDIDALIAVPQLSMPGFFEALIARGFTVDLERNIRELRDAGITTIRYGDVLVDLLRPVLPAYQHALDRAQSADILGHRVRISSAEGLIVMKLMAMRPQDQSDIQDLLTAYAGQLDIAFIRREMETFTLPDDPRRIQFEDWVRRALTH